MGCLNRKCLSLLVAWLNILICWLISLSYFFIHVIPINYTGAMKQVVFTLQMVLFDELMLFTSCGFSLWLMPTIFLLEGIRQNRRKFMAPWIYLSFVLIIILNIGLLVMYYAYGFYGHYYCIFIAVFEGFLIVSLIPVTMLYKQMNIPPLVLPTQCNMEINEQEDHQRYMPIFDN